MPPERITLSRKVREYFAAIGQRGGAAGRRELTRQQAKTPGRPPRGETGREKSWQTSACLYRQTTRAPPKTGAVTTLAKTHHRSREPIGESATSIVSRLRCDGLDRLRRRRRGRQE